jgi:NADPH2:quinone reductase
VRALELQKLAGPDGLVFVDRPIPEGDGQVVVDVRAAGVCFPDLLMSRGSYQFRPQLPAVLGSEVAGTVCSVPAGHRLRTGDRVWATMELGGFAELAAVPADQVFPLPDHLSFEEGASLGVNFLTAVFALEHRGALRAGETVLVLGAAGGLGTAITAVAKARGAHVVAVVSLAEKAATARSSGADEVIVGTEWRPQVLELTDGRGADLVADVVGGENTLQAIRTAAPEGRVLVLGFTAGEIPSIATNRLLLRNVALVGVGLGALTAKTPHVLGETAARLNRLIADGLRPLVGTAMPLEQGASAIRLLEDRKALGKIVLTVP